MSLFELLVLNKLYSTPGGGSGCGCLLAIIVFACIVIVILEHIGIILISILTVIIITTTVSSFTRLKKEETEENLKNQTIEKIQKLADDYVKDFIEQNKTSFSHEDLKAFTVIVKFRNGIEIPKLKKYCYKEHPLLLDILEKTYNKLINK